jgi:hypothetical protein
VSKCIAFPSSLSPDWHSYFQPGGSLENSVGVPCGAN